MSSLLTLFFPRAGYIVSDSTVTSAYSNRVGYVGYAWSSTINGNYAHVLEFYDTTVYPSGGGYGSFRYLGLPVRCLVK